MKRRGQTKSKHDAAGWEKKRTEVRRRFCTHFQLWRVCGKSTCERARACSGDVDACWSAFWQFAPEEMKIPLRAGIKARNEGATPTESIRIAEQKVAQWREQEAKFAAQAEARAAAAAAPPADAKPVVAGPRIRSL